MSQDTESHLKMWKGSWFILLYNLAILTLTAASSCCWLLWQTLTVREHGCKYFLLPLTTGFYQARLWLQAPTAGSNSVRPRPTSQQIFCRSSSPPCFVLLPQGSCICSRSSSRPSSSRIPLTAQLNSFITLIFVSHSCDPLRARLFFFGN